MKYIKIWIALCVTLAFFSLEANAQNADQVSIKSIVYDDKGNPVAGALVSANQGKTETYTDESGQFTITVPAQAFVLITAKGFKMQTLRANAIPARIDLTSDNETEQVYVPFKKIDKQDLPGAVTVLNPETYIDNDYNLTVQGGMNGRVGGLLWDNNIWGLENAIVMIDGIRREFRDITLVEVQQITVLKGVNAVALYGSQAAKGVILITTKKGEANNRKITVRANSGIALPRELPQYLGSADYMELYNEALRNDGLPDLHSATTIQNHRTGNQYRYPSVDYYSSDYLRKFQTTSDANAEFSGGNSMARFYSNIGWSSSSTLLKIGEGKNEKDTRLSLRGNIDLKLNDKISSSIYVSVIFNDSHRGRGNYWGNAATALPHRFAPLVPIDMILRSDIASLDKVKASRNIINGKYLLGGTQQFQTNPIADLYVAGYDKNIRRTFQVTNSIDVNLNSLMQGLSLHTLFNLDYANSYLQSVNNTYSVYTPTWSASGDSIINLNKYGVDARTGNQNINNTTQNQNIGVSSWLSYDKNVNDAHNISATLLGYLSSIKVNDVYQPTTNAHLGMQFSYNYKHRYWADFSGTYVNSNKLPEGNRGAFSPTMSLGWLLSSEKFLARSKAINHLKLSVSAGILNTDLDISGYYLYDNIYTSQAFFTWNDGIQAQNRASQSSHGANPDLSYPRRKELNAGIEGIFFKNLLSVQATFFATTMDGLPTQRFSQYPSYFATFIPYTNYNANRRTGIDLMININKKVGSVDLNLGVNATYAKSKVVKRDEIYADAYRNRTGKPADAIFGLVSNGFFMDQNDIDLSPRQAFGGVRPGDIKYVDQNGDNIIDDRDEVMIGRWIAPLNYGIIFSATYKNVNLYMLGTASSGGNGVKNNDYYWVDGDNKYSEVVWDRWTEATKTTAKYPRLSSSQNNNNFRYSDFWVFKTNRFNLSKVQLTYTLPANVIRKTFVRDIGLYVSGSNLFTFSKNRKILDLSVASTPQFRYYNAGIRARF
jgi:TonB-linked SusC/RagA family outer membrane protein